MRSLVLSLIALMTFGESVCASAQQSLSRSAKPRVIITADPELDDLNSLIRAVLHTTDFDLEGLVYVSSQVHWKGDGKGTTQYIAGREYARLGMCKEGCTSWRWPQGRDELFIDEVVDAYAKAYPNLKVHDRSYPTPATLKSKILWGNVSFEGDYSADTPGSNLIKRLLLDFVPGPLYVTAQGGQSTIARALKSIYDQYHSKADWTSMRDKVSRKLIIIPWGDQDGTYAKYIKPNWPQVINWQLAMIDYGYGIRATLSPENAVYVSGAWTRKNVLDQGPFGALYRVWGDGKVMVQGDPTDYFGMIGHSVEELRTMGYAPFTPPQEKDSFISEGDTPTFLNLIQNGLLASNNGDWGGWGGIRRENAQSRRGPAVTPAGPDDNGIADGLSPAGTKNPGAPGNKPADQHSEAQRPMSFPRPVIALETAAVNARFFAASQNDFAARLRWSATPRYKDANHPPQVSVTTPANATVKAGDSLPLQVRLSDPDGNKVHLVWWIYRDASTYKGTVSIADPSAVKTTLSVPSDAKSGETIHIIAEVTDDGSPALTRYARTVLTVK